MRPLFEKIPLSQKTSFEIREFKLSRFDAPLHFHPEFELTWIAAGEGKRVVGDHITDYQANDLVLIGPNLPHYWYSENTTGEERLSHSMVIQFDESFLGNHFFKIPEMASIYKLLDKARRGISINAAIKADITSRMQRLLMVEGSQRIFGLLAILDILSQSDNHIPLASQGFNQYVDTTDCERINKVCQYVFENFTAAVNLTEAAAITHMSTPAFCFYFKKRTRRNFSQFVNEIRIGYACKLLMETDKTITQICFASGFNNLSNFNRRFKEFHSISPVQYRKQF